MFGLRGKIFSFGFVLIAGSLGLASAAQGASEPAYCDPARFFQLEIQPEAGSSLVRLKAFQVGKAVLAGMAIGLSEFQPMATLAEWFGAAAEEKYCTWYLNSGHEAAEKAFNHIYLESPLKLTPAEAVEEFLGRLQGAFLEGDRGFIGCLEQRGFLALGCNGQSHRGPAVFGMILAFSGCSPDHAEEIADTLWGLNGVDRNVRLATIEAAHRLGGIHPDLQQRLRAVFE